jgi:CDP-glucose 4,6-dehydratase
MPDFGFWRNRRVLVTGHTGFKGSWLALWLEMLEAEVWGYALPPRTPDDNYAVCRLDQKIKSVLGDIRDSGRLEKLFAEVRPEVVFHLAAQPLVRESYDSPQETFDVNVGGTVNLLERCRKSDSVRVVVNITSDKCYENLELRRGYCEGDRLGGHDPYSASKAAAEIITTAYRRSFFAPTGRVGLASARAGNVIGGGDWQKDRLLPDCIRSLFRGRTITIRHPHATRPWQHVLEPLAGYLSLAERLAADPQAFDSAWNFGPRSEDIREVGAVVELVTRIWGGGKWEIASGQELLHESTLLHLDSSKAIAGLGWSPRWSLETSLEKTVAWYREFFCCPERMYEFSCQQVHAFQKAREVS